MNNKIDIIFAGNNGLYKSDWSKFDWRKENGFYYDKSDIVFDAKSPFLCTFNPIENGIYKSYINEDDTYLPIDHEDDSFFCQDIRACQLSGDIYILTNKELIGEPETSTSNVLGGRLIHYDNSTRESSDVSLIREDEIYHLCGASSMAYDYVRKRLWVADTFNHKIIAININSWEIETVINRNDIVFPSSIEVNIVTGDVFVQAYYSDQLQEMMVIIREEEVASIFTTPGCFGWADNDYPMDFFFVLDNHPTDNSANLYRIGVATGMQAELCQHYDANYVAITADPISRNVMSYDSDGVGHITLFDKTDGGVAYTGANVNMMPFVCFVDGHHWYFSVRLDGLPNIARVRVGGDNGTVIPYVESGDDLILRNPSCGDVLHLERCPIVVEEEALVKISNDGERIEKRVEILQPCNLIATHFDGEILILKKEDSYGYIYDVELNLLGTYDLVDNVMAVVAHHAVSNVYWILFENNEIKKVELKDDAVNVLGSAIISTTNECIGLCYDFNYNRPIVYSRKGVYCVATHGNSLVWSREDFEYIGDITATNNFFKLHQKHKWFTRRCMKYDVLRNKLWWIARGQDDYSCCLNENLMSVSSFKLPKPVIRFEYDSSSSSSSFL